MVRGISHVGARRVLTGCRAAAAATGHGAARYTRPRQPRGGRGPGAGAGTGPGQGWEKWKVGGGANFFSAVDVSRFCRYFEVQRVPGAAPGPCGQGGACTGRGEGVGPCWGWTSGGAGVGLTFPGLAGAGQATWPLYGCCQGAPGRGAGLSLVARGTEGLSQVSGAVTQNCHPFLLWLQWLSPASNAGLGAACSHRWASTAVILCALRWCFPSSPGSLNGSSFSKIRSWISLTQLFIFSGILVYFFFRI